MQSTIRFVLNIWILLQFVFCSVAVGNTVVEYVEHKGFNQIISLTTRETTNTELLLQQGYRAFWLEDRVPSSDFFRTINEFLQSDAHAIVSLICKDVDVDGMIQEYGLEDFVYNQFPEENYWPAMKEMVANNRRLLVFTDKKSGDEYLPLARLICEWKIPTDKKRFGYVGDPSSDLTLVDFTQVNDSIDTAAWMELFNEQTAKVSNYVFVNDTTNILSIINQKNKQRQYKATVLLDGYKLGGVRWKQMPEMISHGNLIIPRKYGKISPFKKGFRFSPDVMSFTAINADVLKVFQAVRLDLRDNLVVHYPFDDDFRNVIDPENDQVIAYQVETIKDKERGRVATFNGHNSYIDCGLPKENYFNEDFTICLWVKPDQLDNNRSFVGKGETFSAKSRNGSLVFTMPGLKDHTSNRINMELDKWQHVAYVVNAGQNIELYRNGVLVSEIEASDMNHTEHSLLIGSNLWDEYFSGMMDDLSIWQRALNSDEIYTIYEYGLKPFTEKKSTSKRDDLGVFYIVLIVLLILLGFVVIYYWIRRKGKSEQPLEENQAVEEEQEQPSRVIIEKNIAEEEIEELLLVDFNLRLFGGFQLKNKNDEDLTNRFSPKRKQLLMLILLYSLYKGKGVTSKKLTDCLWAGHSAQSAKNNRSTNIQRLRDILNEDSGIQVEYADKHWRLVVADWVECDFVHYQQLKDKLRVGLAKGRVDREILEQFFHVIAAGPLLPNMEYEWMDHFQNEINEEVLDILQSLAEGQDEIYADKVADALFLFDPINEQALTLKIQSLNKQGKKKLALDVFEHFQRTYMNFYGEEFTRDYKDFL
ncbi:hypothetical protein EYV94_16920 [Puteibacter caeruleilacunae]|nr:hypothetical protein EYV94_16920 [Puteibacter caeruleilacunae]